MLIHGRCHCGNIAFALDWQPEPTQIPARACGCSFCTAHGGVWTSNPRAALRIEIADRTLVSEYEFGTRTAQFQVCSRCGVVPLVTSRIDGRLYAVVNVNTFQGVDPALLFRSAANFDGESEDVRLTRRQRYWIGDVQYVDRIA
jgi:hypothetical protein